MTCAAEKTYWRVAALGPLLGCPFCGADAHVMVSSILRMRQIACSAAADCPLWLQTSWFLKAAQADYETRWNTRAGGQGSVASGQEKQTAVRAADPCPHLNRRIEPDGEKLCTDCGEIL